jgi:tRNA pseudouridine38-40 synthase
LNAVSEDIYFYGIAEVPLGFSPRRARQRWYRYFLSADDLDMDRVRECASEFEGKHDFRMFCKGDERGTVRSIDSVEIFRIGDLIVVDFRAREFLWNMVRRMVSALSEVGRGRASVREVKEALSGKEKAFGLAPADYLVLIDIVYDFDFEIGCPSTLKEKVRRGRNLSFMKLAFFDDLSGRCGTKSQRVD